MSLIKRNKAVALATATSVLAWAAPAYAQDDAAQDDEASGNSIIIVTAQKKSQNLSHFLNYSSMEVS